jgi:hypothetical protein
LVLRTAPPFRHLHRHRRNALAPSHDVRPRRIRIGSLDHELFAGCEDLEQFLEEMELSGFAAASVDEQTDMLCDEDQGLIWFHASSMDSFVQQCVFCDEDGSGFVVDEPGLEED